MIDILIISPAYPPFSGVGAIRMNSLSQMLRDNNFRVTIVRNNPKSWPEYMLKGLIPYNIEIIDVDIKSQDSFYICMKKYKNALSSLLELRKFDLAIFSGGPFYTFTAATYVKIKHNLKYIVEFRDLWVYNYRKSSKRSILNTIKLIIFKILAIYIEYKTIVNATNIILSCKGDLELMRQFYRKHEHKMSVIYNGINESFKMKDEKITINKKKNVIAIFGKFSYYAPELAGKFLNSVNRLNQEGFNIQILHIGEMEEYIINFINNSQLHNINYNNTGFMNYDEGIELLNSANIFLLIENHPHGLGTKVYDYIRLNKPIIGIIKDGDELVEFISNFSNSFVCTNENQICNSIKNIIVNRIGILDKNIDIQKYSRIKQNIKYMELIKSITS